MPIMENRISCQTEATMRGTFLSFMRVLECTASAANGQRSEKKPVLQQFQIWTL